jgi:hypothetical protein
MNRLKRPRKVLYSVVSLKRGNCMKKKILPDFDKMTHEEEAKWFDSHDLDDYWDELEPVDIAFQLEKPKLTEQLPDEVTPSL